MFDGLRDFTLGLGINIDFIPDLVLAALIILVVIVALRLAASIANTLIRVGCAVVTIFIIVYVLLQLFT
ncbi:MAG: hypothetical protein M9928_19785 [Anaerolineae bacterium]|nr:hypothetical protein [Anaerolineae bacterium]MCO5207257.1 hypothetical protein [Anaerolineae bacterium]